MAVMWLTRAATPVELGDPSGVASLSAFWLGGAGAVPELMTGEPAGVASLFAYWLGGGAAGPPISDRPPAPGGDYWHGNYWPGAPAAPKEKNA